EARPELRLERGIGVDAVVVAIREGRLLGRLADAQADDRARPRRAAPDPGLELVDQAILGSRARRGRREVDEAELYRVQRASHDGVEREVRAADVQRDVIGEGPAGRVDLDGVPDAREERRV